MTPEQKYLQLYERFYNLCQENGWGDPFSYARSREINIAAVLGHQISNTYSGADAYDGDIPLEYKSTISRNINATYNGISVQNSWEEQERYIIKDKIGKYPRHYYARFNDGKIAEVWELTSDKVLDTLLPKIKKQYFKKKNSNVKDPRIGVTVSQKEVHQNGIQVR